MPAQDVTVTGSFTVNRYAITYIVDGEVYATDSIEYGATITPIAEPVKEGYDFSGWSEVPETMPAQDVTVTGSFTATGIDEILLTEQIVDVYSISGTLLKKGIRADKVKEQLGLGIYIVGGKRYYLK